MKRFGWIKSLWLAILSLFLFSCLPSSTGSTFSFDEVINILKKIGTLGMPGSEQAMIGFIRFCVFILVFALLFEAGTRLNILSRRIAGVIAFVLALISAIGIPAAILAGISGTYAFVFSLVLIATPIVAALWAIYGPLPGFVHGRVLHLIRIVILIIALWILIWVKNQAASLVV